MQCTVVVYIHLVTLEHNIARLDNQLLVLRGRTHAVFDNVGQKLVSHDAH